VTGSERTTKVAFGTEGGLFSRDLGVATVICGPGSMDQGHRPDEFITVEQMERCKEMLERTIEKLRTSNLM
jgi:acetylornithine deacetylase